MKKKEYIDFHRRIQKKLSTNDDDNVDSKFDFDEEMAEQVPFPSPVFCAKFVFSKFGIPA